MQAEGDHRDAEGHEALGVERLPGQVGGDQGRAAAAHHHDWGAGHAGEGTAAGEVVGGEEDAPDRPVGRLAVGDHRGDEEGGAAVGAALGHQRPRDRAFVQFTDRAQRPERAGDREAEGKRDHRQRPLLFRRQHVLRPRPQQAPEEDAENRPEQGEAGQSRLQAAGQEPGQGGRREQQQQAGQGHQRKAEAAPAQPPPEDARAEQQGDREGGGAADPEQIDQLRACTGVAACGRGVEDAEQAGHGGRGPEAQHHRPLPPDRDRSQDEKRTTGFEPATSSLGSLRSTN